MSCPVFYSLRFNNYMQITPSILIPSTFSILVFILFYIRHDHLIYINIGD